MATRRSTNAAKPLLSCAHLFACFNDLAIFIRVPLNEWTLGLRNRLCSHHGIVFTTANMTNIFSITFLRLLFFCMCSAGFTVGMRNRKRNHQNDTSETDVTNQTNYLNLTCVRAIRPERPKRVQQNKQYDLP